MGANHSFIFDLMRRTAFMKAVLAGLLLCFVVTAAFPLCHKIGSVSFVEICSGITTKVIAVVDNDVVPDQGPLNGGHEKPSHKDFPSTCPNCSRVLTAVTLDYDLGAFLSPAYEARFSADTAVYDPAYTAADLFPATAPRAPPATV
jgi:hypothetical protein